MWSTLKRIVIASSLFFSVPIIGHKPNNKLCTCYAEMESPDVNNCWWWTNGNPKPFFVNTKERREERKFCMSELRVHTRVGLSLLKLGWKFCSMAHHQPCVFIKLKKNFNFICYELTRWVHGWRKLLQIIAASNSGLPVLKNGFYT